MILACITVIPPNEKLYLLNLKTFYCYTLIVRKALHQNHKKNRDLVLKNILIPKA